MHNPPDILAIAYKQTLMEGQLVQLQERQQQIPGSVQYAINRYRRHPQWNIDDTGMMVYHYESSTPKENYLELKFCVSGNVYCRKKDTECDMCQFGESKNCVERVDSIDVVSFRFSPVVLSQFVKPRKGNTVLTDDILSLRTIHLLQRSSRSVVKQEWYSKAY